MLAVLKASGANRVLDLGCGSGKLLGALIKEPAFERIVGVDISHRALEVASSRLRLERLAPRQRERVQLFQTALTYRDKRLAGFDAAAVVEVIEHFDRPRLSAFERVTFGEARPSTVVVTTPNREYNAKFDGLPAGTVPSPRPSLRVDAITARGLGGRGRRALWLRRALPGGRPRGSAARGAHPDGGVRAVSEQATVTAARELDVPELSLVVLVGASGSGKSTFAAKHFLSTEVLSSDHCRALVADDENDQGATSDAFELLHFIAAKRMAGARLTVVDATSVKREDRARLVRLAREHHFLPVAIVFDVPERLCKERNESRPDRDFGSHVIRNQIRDLRRGLRGLRKEGFRHVHTLSDPEAVDAAGIKRTPLWNNRTDEHGPFDIIGDVHGCCRRARSAPA